MSVYSPRESQVELREHIDNLATGETLLHLQYTVQSIVYVYCKLLYSQHMDKIIKLLRLIEISILVSFTWLMNNLFNQELERPIIN